MADTVAAVLIIETNTVELIDGDGAIAVGAELSLPAEVFVDAPSVIGAGAGAGNEAIAGDRPVFISDTAPSSPPNKYIWFQTGIGVGGADFTLWIEDGS